MGGKGGGTTVVNEEKKIDPVLQVAGQTLAPLAFQAAAIGGVARNPYMGPTIAGPNQGMMQAMDATTQGANALGLGFNSLQQSVPEQMDYGGGVHGYSPYPIAQQAMQAIDPWSNAATQAFYGNLGQYATAGQKVAEKAMNTSTGPASTSSSSGGKK